MSPTRRPSAVDGLRRGVSTVQAAPAPVAEARPAKPVRVTLNLPPALYRDVERWALDAADALSMPRVSIQDAMRAMIRACVTDGEASGAAQAQIRQA